MNAQEYNRNIPLPGIYAKSWKALNAMPTGKVVSVPGWVVGMAGWNDQTVTAGMALHHLRKALDNRINARAGYTPRQPREEEYRLRRDAQAIKDRITRRIRVYSFDTNTARKRFSHLLARHDD